MVAEKNNYHGGPINETNAGQFAHYTQMVWNTTKLVGCAIASGNGRDVLDCRYSPGGNIIGQKTILGEPCSCHCKYSYYSLPRPSRELLQGISNGIVRRSRVLIISTFTPSTTRKRPVAQSPVLVEMGNGPLNF